jgi:uncharacterized protein
MRILLLITAIVAIFLIVRVLLRRPPREAQPDARLKDQGSIVRCDHCGTHIPQQEAVRQGDRSYCSRDHALADARDRDDR